MLQCPGQEETLHLFEFVNETVPSAYQIDQREFPPYPPGQPENDAKIAEKKAMCFLVWKIYLSIFSGVRKENHPIRTALRELNTEDRVSVIVKNDHIELVNYEGEPVARLSKKAKSRWVNRTGGIYKRDEWLQWSRPLQKQILKMKNFEKACFGDTWEVPIVELVNT